VTTKLEIGESFVGEGANAAHVNTVLGRRSGPAGIAWATGLASPSSGHVPFVAVLRPGLPVKPLTLFVNKGTLAGAAHAELTWGPAQAGVAGGVADAVASGAIDAQALDDLVLIAAVWVDPRADDAEAIYRNNREATRRALEAGRSSAPSLAEVLAAAKRPYNPFFSSRG
jgi:5,6,7,8-tetrahydromethanopterin hydro-lyase